MQISRHWRLNAQRYRLEGVRQDNGAVNLQERHASLHNQQLDETDTQEVHEVTSAGNTSKSARPVAAA